MGQDQKVQQVDEIDRARESSIKGKVIALWSPVAGTGVTFTSINLALELNKDYKVVLVDYDLELPSINLYFNTSDTTHCIDSVIPFCASHQLSIDILENNLQRFEGLCYLAGTTTPDQAQYFEIEHLTNIIEVLRENYDYVVVDCHNFINNAGSYVALKEADSVLLVVDKNVINIRQYKSFSGLLHREFGMTKFNLVVNKSHKSIYMESNDIEGFMDIEGSSVLPHLGFGLINSINKGQWIEFVGKNREARHYKKAIRDLALNKITNEKLTGEKNRKGFSLFNFGK